ncbi:MAG: NADH-quinone oxidoreductase subunit NuoK [Nitrospirae bacterium]|nr:NADH-quinone oxidoreductase subunit NuoK [Nitrospirota bacterium]
MMVAAGLFLLGGFCVIRRKHAVGVLMGVELILNSAALNFAAAAKLRGVPLEGQVAAIFVILLAAAEAVVVLAATLAIYHQVRTANADEVRELKG